MLHESRRVILAALFCALLVVVASVLTTDHAERANPDRDSTRVERVTDVQLPTL